MFSGYFEMIIFKILKLVRERGGKERNGEWVWEEKGGGLGEESGRGRRGRGSGESGGRDTGEGEKDLGEEMDAGGVWGRVIYYYSDFY